MSNRIAPLASLAIFFALAFFVFCSQANATSVLKLDINQQSYSLGNKLEYIEDKAGQFDIEAVRQQPEGAWQKNSTVIPNFGFSKSVYWFRINLETLELQKRLLEIDYPLLDEIVLYLFAEDRQIQKIETGDMKPFFERPLQLREFIFPLDLPAAGQVALYLRVQSAGAVQVPLNLWNEAAFYHQDEKETAILGIFFGIIIVMLLYNLFIYLRVYEPAYIYYVLYVISFGFFMAGMSGWGYMYLWPEAIHFQQYNTAIFVACCGIFACRFIHYFLDLPSNSPKLGRLLFGLAICLLLLLCLLPFTSYHIIVQLALAIVLVAALAAIYCGIRLWRQGDVAARYFTIAWSTFLLSVVLATLEKFGLIADTNWAGFFLPFGMALEVTLLSLALGERINTEKQHRIQAQEDVIRVQEKSKAELEHKVVERTVELAESNAKLEEANEKLLLLATTDGLTGITNRRHFLELTEHSINVAKRYKRPIAMIMLDIDFFKDVNDTYGHDVGDKVLQHVVSTCAGVYRETDIFGRLGGEEFGTLLLESVSPESAFAVAERLRIKVESTPLEYEGKSISVTVSQGVCTIEPTQPYLTVEQMLKVADEALYQAKEAGRNQVVMLSGGV